MPHHPIPSARGLGPMVELRHRLGARSPVSSRSSSPISSFAGSTSSLDSGYTSATSVEANLPRPRGHRRRQNPHFHLRIDNFSVIIPPAQPDTAAEEASQRAEAERAEALRRAPGLTGKCKRVFARMTPYVSWMGLVANFLLDRVGFGVNVNGLFATLRAARS